MIKAVFCDFYGTLVEELGPIPIGIMKRIAETGSGTSLEVVAGYWWKTYRARLGAANGADYRTQKDLTLENFRELVEHFHSPEIPEELSEKMAFHWCHPVMYDESQEFLDLLGSMELPVYLVTNCDEAYIQAAVRHTGIHPDGIFTSEQARYSKPRKELFLYALEQLGLRPDEVIHLGDSLSGDVEGAGLAGIRAIWVNRENKPVPEGIQAVSALKQINQATIRSFLYNSNIGIPKKEG